MTPTIPTSSTPIDLDSLPPHAARKLKNNPPAWLIAMMAETAEKEGKA